MELFPNYCQTLVAAGGYTAGSGLLNVASTASPWPATGNFRVTVLDSAGALKVILKVTGVNSTTQWAVTAEGTDANADAGNLVYGGMLTAGAMQAFREDILRTPVHGSVLQSACAVVANVAQHFDVTAGNIILVAFCFVHATSDLATCSDTVGTVYTRVVTGGSIIQRIALFWGIAAGSGPNTVTCALAGHTWPVIGVTEILPGAWTAIDASASAVGSYVALTTTAPMGFVFAALAGNQSGSWSFAAGGMAQLLFINGADSMATGAFIAADVRTYECQFMTTDVYPVMAALALK